MKFLVRHDQWHDSHTTLSKYLVTYLYQLVDIDEVISYRYTITNGMILLEELYDTATYCLQRPKTQERLKSLLQECIDKDIDTSIVNDIIIQEYFRNIIKECECLCKEMQSQSKKSNSKEENSKEKEEIKEQVVKNIQTKTLIYLSTIQSKYIENVFRELKKINFISEHFDTEANKIKKLAKILVAHALHKGHSIIHLKISFKNLVKDSRENLIEQLDKVFSFEQEREYTYLIPAPEDNNPLLDQLKAQLIEDDKYESYTYKFNAFGKDASLRIEDYKYEFTASGKDASSAFRNRVTDAFRKLSLKSPNVESDFLKNIWKNSLFLNEKTSEIKNLNLIEDGDPIIPLARINNLDETLNLGTKFKIYKNLQEIADETLEKFEDSLYLYHLALGVPTIENSYLLLWTALESLMGLQNNQADIITIKENVSSTLALGAVGRRVNATIQRMKSTSYANNWGKRYSPKNDNQANEYATTGLCHWIEWITDQRIKEDPFEDMKNEPLLCKQYRDINENWKNLKDLHDVMVRAKKNTEYQLDRLYQTRNRIVHSGRFGRTGIYLWIHLEWYVAKLLASSILIMDGLSNNLTIDGNPRDIVFGCLRGQYQSSIDYLNRHKDKTIDFEHILESGITRFPYLCF